MADIYSLTNQQFGGAFPIDGAKISFSGSDGNLLGVGFVTQNLNYQYAQPITTLFEVGTNNVYVVAGRARGSAGLARVLGPRPIISGFYSQYGNVCNMGSNILSLDCASGSCPAVSSGAFVLGMHYAVITSVGGSVTSENALFSENVALQYLTLDLS